MDPAVITCPVYRNSQNHPDRVAIRSDKQSLTYAELERLIQGFAGKLKTAGMKTGDRIGVIAGNSVGCATLIHAAYRTGVTLVPINIRLNPDDWIDCIKRSGCKLLFADADRSAFARNSGSGFVVMGGDESYEVGETTIGEDSSVSREVLLDQETSVVFTSGSGGFPKGVILTYGNHYHNALASNENIQLNRDDCWLAVLPFYHVGGMSILSRAAIAGCSVYVMNGFDTGRINRLIDERIITHISLVPTMLASLLAAREMKRPPATLRAILLGGGPVPGSLLDDIEKLSLPVLTTYGMTETASQL
jgi:O-succinylbenzoic acid--CoA ligase